MKFGLQFEFHKIPEWYSEYLDYRRFKAMIKRFKIKVKSNLIPFHICVLYIGGDVEKLRGLYYLTQKKCVIPMDVFDHPQNHHSNDTTKDNANSGGQQKKKQLHHMNSITIKQSHYDSNRGSNRRELSAARKRGKNTGMLVMDEEEGDTDEVVMGQ